MTCSRSDSRGKPSANAGVRYSQMRKKITGFKRMRQVYLRWTMSLLNGKLSSFPATVTVAQSVHLELHICKKKKLELISVNLLETIHRVKDFQR